MKHKAMTVLTVLQLQVTVLLTPSWAFKVSQFPQQRTGVMWQTTFYVSDPVFSAMSDPSQYVDAAASLSFLELSEEQLHKQIADAANQTQALSVQEHQWPSAEGAAAALLALQDEECLYKQANGESHGEPNGELHGRCKFALLSPVWEASRALFDDLWKVPGSLSWTPTANPIASKLLLA